MDQIGPTKRLEIERQIIRMMMTGVSQGTFASDDSQIVAKIVLAEMPKIHTETDLMNFYNYLARQWPIFASLSRLENAKASEVRKSEVLSNTMSKIHSGDIDGALAAMKGGNSY